jgi:hypothetical protein
MRKVRSTTSGGTSGNDTANRYTTSVTERVSSSGDGILRILPPQGSIAKIVPGFGDPVFHCLKHNRARTKRRPSGLLSSTPRIRHSFLGRTVGERAVHPLFVPGPMILTVGEVGSTDQRSESVPLSDWDRSRLREIEEHTRATFADFVTRLDLAVFCVIADSCVGCAGGCWDSARGSR